MKKAILLLVSVLLAVGALWSWMRGSTPDAATLDSRLMADRVWIDHIPRNERDTIRVFIAVSEHSVGVFQATSQWRGAYEAFRYEAQGGELRLVFPQSGNRETVKVKARRCDESGFDFCLELDGASRGVKRYFSRKGWEIDGAATRSSGALDDRAIIDAIEHQADALRTQLAQ